MSHAPSTFNHLLFFSPPLIADFCAHLFLKGVSFCAAVVTCFCCVSFLFHLVTLSSNFACWLKFLVDLFQREVFPYCYFAVCCLFAAL